MGNKHEAANTIDRVLPRGARRYLYGIALAITGILAAKGFLDESLLALVNSSIAAVLGVALVNVPVDEEE